MEHSRLSVFTMMMIGVTVCLVSCQSGDGTTTRYWDCCKTTCAWRENAGSVSNPVRTCGVGGTDGVAASVQSGCAGGSAFTCNNQQPFILDGNAYAFAAANVEGIPPSESCCTCYQLKFTNSAIVNKVLTVQIINSGTDLVKNQFDLQIPGGGFGIFTQGCPAQWPAFSAPNLWGAQYGGVGSRDDCKNLPGPLVSGCLFRFDWMQGESNPTVNFQKVSCPSSLTDISGCSR